MERPIHESVVEQKTTGRKCPQPRLAMKATVGDWVRTALGVVAILVTFGLILLNWNQLPEKIPHHFDISGKPDGWGHKAVLWPLPGIAVVLFVLLSVFSRLPHRFNYLVTITAENASRQYRLAQSMLSWLKLEIVLLVLILTWLMIRVALGQSQGLGALTVPFFLLAIFVTVMIHLVKSMNAK